MKKVFTAREVSEFLASGKTEADLPKDIILTPSGRDVLKENVRTKRGISNARFSAPSATSNEPTVPDHEYNWEPGSDPQTPEAIQRFYNSSDIKKIREHMCSIGERIWTKGYVDGNGGNLTVRVGDNLVLCTPTLISKGYMKADEMCLVDMDGNQLAGKLKRTSEVNTHLGIMKRQPKAKSCCHAHPPHATAFAVAGFAPPSCMIPEAEVFLGKIGLAPYETPGSPENARVVGEIGMDHQSIIMANHGVITWGKDIEDSYWKMENTDAYCLTIWIASQLGTGVKTIHPDKVKELISIRQNLGMEDIRSEYKDCELCENTEFLRSSITAPSNAGSCCSSKPDTDAEAAVRQITEEIMKQLGK